MIAFVRVAGIKPGKTASAMTFAREVAKYIKTHHQVDLEILRPVGGNPQRVAWSARYANMAAMETFTNKLLADAQYWDLVNASSDSFIAGSMHDAIWQTL